MYIESVNREEEDFELVEIQIARMHENIPKYEQRDSTVRVLIPPTREFVRMNLKHSRYVSDRVKRRTEDAAHVPCLPFEIRP